MVRFIETGCFVDPIDYIKGIENKPQIVYNNLVNERELVLDDKVIDTTRFRQDDNKPKARLSNEVLRGKENETLYNSQGQRGLQGRTTNVRESVDESGASEREFNSGFGNYLNLSENNLAVKVRKIPKKW